MHLPGGLDETKGLTFTLENTVYFYNKIIKGNCILSLSSIQY